MASALHRLSAARKARQARKVQLKNDTRRQINIEDPSHTNKTFDTCVVDPHSSQTLTLNPPIPHSEARSHQRLTPGSALVSTASHPGFIERHRTTRQDSSHASQLEETVLAVDRLQLGDGARDGMNLLEPEAGERDGYAGGKVLQDSEDDDPTESPIYARLSRMTAYWSRAALILLPSQRALAAEATQEVLADDLWISRHAFVPSRLFKERYVSIDADEQSSPPSHLWLESFLEVSFDEQGIADIVCTHMETGKRSHRRLKISTELSLYRPAKATSTAAAAFTAFEVLSRPDPRDTSRQVNRKLTLVVVEGLVLPSMQSLIDLRSSKPIQGEAASSTHPFDVLSSHDPSGRSPSLQAKGQHLHDSIDRQNSMNHVYEEVFIADRTRSVVLPPPPDFASSATSGVPSRRCFETDLLFLLSPPETQTHASRSLAAALETLVANAREFVETFVMVPNFEQYIEGRLREGVLSKSWTVLEKSATSEWRKSGLVAGSKRNLVLLLQNVIMGLVHFKVYPSLTIGHADYEENVRLASVLYAYRQARIGMLDLGATPSHLIKRVVRLDAAIKLLALWRKGECNNESNAPDDTTAEWIYVVCDRQQRSELRQRLVRNLLDKGNKAELDDFDLDLDNSVDKEHSLTWFGRPTIANHSFTPLDILQTLRECIDAIMAAAARGSAVSLITSSMSSSSSLHSPSLAAQNLGKASSSLLGTDDLLPVLAYVLVRAAPASMCSRLRYARLLGLSSELSPEFEWALVTFEAVVHWLLEDPLGLVKGVSSADAHMPAAKVDRMGAPIVTKETGRRSDSLSAKEKTSENILATMRDRRLSLPSATLLANLKLRELPVGSEFSTVSMSRNGSTASTASLSSNRTAQSLIPAGPRGVQCLRPGSPSYQTSFTIRPQIVTRPRPSIQSNSSQDAGWLHTDAEALPDNCPQRASNGSTDMSRAESEGATPIQLRQPLHTRSAPRRRSLGSVSLLNAAPAGSGNSSSLPLSDSDGVSSLLSHRGGGGDVLHDSSVVVNAADTKLSVLLPFTASTWSVGSSIAPQNACGQEVSTVSQFSEPALSLPHFSVFNTDNASDRKAVSLTAFRRPAANRTSSTIRSRSRPPSMVSSTAEDVIPENRPYVSSTPYLLKASSSQVDVPKSVCSTLPCSRTKSRSRWWSLSAAQVPCSTELNNNGAVDGRRAPSSSSPNKSLTTASKKRDHETLMTDRLARSAPFPASKEQDSVLSPSSLSPPSRSRKRTLSHLLPAAADVGGSPLPPKLVTSSAGGPTPTAELSSPHREGPPSFSGFLLPPNPLIASSNSASFSLSSSSGGSGAHKRSHSEALLGEAAGTSLMDRTHAPVKPSQL